MILTMKRPDPFQNIPWSDIIMKHSLNPSRPILSLHLAVMMFGLSGVIGRIVHVSPIALAGGRVLCSSAVLLLILLFRKQTLKAASRTDTALTCLAGLLLAVHWISFFQSVQTASVAIGTITYSTFPLFLLILEPLLYHEKMSLRNGLLSLGLLAGVLITVPEFSLTNTTTLGILWGMLSSVSYAFLTLVNRRLSRSYTGTWVSFREQGTAALLLLPLLILRREPATPTDLLGIAAIGFLCTALGFSLFVSAQRHVSAQTAGIVAGMETVYGILFAGLFIGEFPTLREIIGGIIILGIAFLASHRKEEQNP